MRLNFPNRKNGAMTAIEVLVVVASIFVLAAIMLAMFSVPNSAHNRARRVECVGNLKQISLAFRVWEVDNNNTEYPMTVSVTNGGGKEFIEKGNVAAFLQVVSNDFSTTKILVCPADPNRTFATNWNELNSSHISYFFGADVSNEGNTNLVLVGDDNLIVGGMPVKSGMLELSSNTPVSWTEDRHKFCGNLCFADNSIVEEGTNGMEKAIQRTGLATNRIAIP